MRKKQQTTEHEDSPAHIILHHTPAALLAEKNLIHLDAGLSLLGHFLGLFVQCLGSLCTFYFILFIKLFLSVYCLNLCRATFAV